MGLFDFWKKNKQSIEVNLTSTDDVSRSDMEGSAGSVSVTDFNFRLAIIQELMYEQELLKPKFEAHAFCQEQGIDYDNYSEEYAYQVPPEIRQWFEQLEIPKVLAEKVTNLYFDGGNEVYCEAALIWDGEDDLFDITEVTAEDLAQFPNLRRIDGTALLMTEEVKETFRQVGIEVID